MTDNPLIRVWNLKKYFSVTKGLLWMQTLRGDALRAYRTKVQAVLQAP